MDSTDRQILQVLTEGMRTLSSGKIADELKVSTVEVEDRIQRMTMDNLMRYSSRCGEMQAWIPEAKAAPQTQWTENKHHTKVKKGRSTNPNSFDERKTIIPSLFKAPDHIMHLPDIISAFEILECCLTGSLMNSKKYFYAMARTAETEGLIVASGGGWTLP
jgi:DNA-binding Lrp family transcriptional regulator